MRVETTSLAIRKVSVQGVDNGRKIDEELSAEQQRLNCETSKQMRKNNFQTIDPESGELITIGEKKLIEAIEKANKTLMGVNTSFEFTIHEQTKEIMVRVINSETNEVIREIPPEKILDLVAKIWELAGILVDERI